MSRFYNHAFSVDRVVVCHDLSFVAHTLINRCAWGLPFSFAHFLSEALIHSSNSRFSESCVCRYAHLCIRCLSRSTFSCFIQEGGITSYLSSVLSFALPWVFQCFSFPIHMLEFRQLPLPPLPFPQLWFWSLAIHSLFTFLLFLNVTGHFFPALFVPPWWGLARVKQCYRASESQWELSGIAFYLLCIVVLEPFIASPYIAPQCRLYMFPRLFRTAEVTSTDSGFCSCSLFW